MREKFQQHLQQNFSFLQNKKLLLAISGGIDSIVLFDLLRQCHNQISIAHCNFQLRGIESDGDQKFVEEMAASCHIRCHIAVFETEILAKNMGMSIQMTARELRYHWFNELLEIEKYDFIVTAHQADDNIETFFINLLRGTGLDGLVGIPEVHDKVLRPLLPFGREEIEVYAESNRLVWREDSSNVSTKYLRNQIRHDLVPILKSIRPDFMHSFQMSQSFLREANDMVEDASAIVYEEVTRVVDDCIEIDLDSLLRLPNYSSYLFRWLKDAGFSDWNAINNLVNSQSGKFIYGDYCRLLKDRNKLILCPDSTVDHTCYLIEKGQGEVKIPLKINVCKVDDICSTTNSTIFVDEDKITYPLQIRKWKEGDSFEPFGMNGQRKKISKYLKDLKLSLHQKEQVWVLCSDDSILWLIGYRMDNRFSVDESTKSILKIAIQQ